MAGPPQHSTGMAKSHTEGREPSAVACSPGLGLELTRERSFIRGPLLTGDLWDTAIDISSAGPTNRLIAHCAVEGARHTPVSAQTTT